MEIKLNKLIYPLEKINKTVKAYEHLADFVLKEQGDYIVLELKNIEASVENELKDEFCNYLLFEIKKSL